jgi:co-chaperonin GroES (HSP10)
MKTETVPIGAKLADAPRTFRPFGSRLLLERVKAVEVTAGGIILPKSKDDAERLFISIVRAVGPDVKNVQEKAWVVHLPYACEQIVINGHPFEVAQEEDILGVLE